MQSLQKKISDLAKQKAKKQNRNNLSLDESLQELDGSGGLKVELRNFSSLRGNCDTHDDDDDAGTSARGDAASADPPPLRAARTRRRVRPAGRGDTNWCRRTPGETLRAAAAGAATEAPAGPAEWPRCRHPPTAGRR